MSRNWLVEAQVQDEIPEPDEATGSMSMNVQEIISSNPQIQQVLQWFEKLKKANEHAPQVREHLESSLEELGITNENLPPEITALFE